MHEVSHGSRYRHYPRQSNGHKLICAIRFGFKVSNNAAEYKALLAGLRLSKEMQ